MSIMSDYMTMDYGAKNGSVNNALGGQGDFLNLAGMTDGSADLNNMGLNGLGMDFGSIGGFGQDPAGGGIFDGALSFLGDNAGGISSGLGALGSLAKAWTGMQQLNAAKGMMEDQKNMYNQNTGIQAQMLNTQMRDRQNALNYGQGTEKKYASTKDYMNQNEIKPQKV